MAGPDFDSEIKQLQATMKHHRQGARPRRRCASEIADLGEQVAAPDLWDDQSNATRVTGRLSALQGELDRFTSLQSRIDDLELMVEMAREEDDADALADAERELARLHKSVEHARGPHPPLRRVRRPRGDRHASARAPAASTRPTSPRC